MDERRINVQLLKYWESLKDASGRAFPSENSINASEIPERESCFLVIVEKMADLKFKFDFLGKNLIEAYCEDFTGLDVESQITSDVGVKLGQHFRTVYANKSPLIVEDEITNKDNMIIKSRTCLLPLGDGETVNFILGGVKWRDF